MSSSESFVESANSCHWVSRSGSRKTTSANNVAVSSCAETMSQNCPRGSLLYDLPLYTALRLLEPISRFVYKTISGFASSSSAICFHPAARDASRDFSEPSPSLPADTSAPYPTWSSSCASPEHKALEAREIDAQRHRQLLQVQPPGKSQTQYRCFQQAWRSHSRDRHTTQTNTGRQHLAGHIQMTNHCPFHVTSNISFSFSHIR